MSDQHGAKDELLSLPLGGRYCTVYNAQCIIYNLRCTTAQCIKYNVQYVLVNCTTVLYNAQSIKYTVMYDCTMYIVLYTIKYYA